MAKGSALTLVWPDASVVPAVLESALEPDGPWTSVDVAPQVADGVRKVEIEVNSDHRFFRLRSGVLSSANPGRFTAPAP